jgi:hypothetical protein
MGFYDRGSDWFWYTNYAGPYLNYKNDTSSAKTLDTLSREYRRSREFGEFAFSGDTTFGSWATMHSRKVGMQQNLRFGSIELFKTLQLTLSANFNRGHTEDWNTATQMGLYPPTSRSREFSLTNRFMDLNRFLKLFPTLNRWMKNPSFSNNFTYKYSQDSTTGLAKQSTEYRGSPFALFQCGLGPLQFSNTMEWGRQNITEVRMDAGAATNGTPSVSKINTNWSDSAGVTYTLKTSKGITLPILGERKLENDLQTFAGLRISSQNEYLVNDTSAAVQDTAGAKKGESRFSFGAGANYSFSAKITAGMALAYVRTKLVEMTAARTNKIVRIWVDIRF